jgi:DNA replication protein DnaC
MNVWGCAVRTSKFGLEPRVKTRNDHCEAHGQYDRRLVEAFDGASKVIGCPNCYWESIHTSDDKSQDHIDAVALKRWEATNASLFATGIAQRFRACSLDNYRTDIDGQAVALDLCRAYVNQFEENFAAGRCLLMLGNFGNGKTHLGCSILKAVVTQYGAHGLYAPAPDIISAIKATFNKGSADTEQEIMAELSSVDLLLIDELGAQGGTEFERNSLHTIIDMRYRKMLPTIITSNLPSAELSTYIGDRALDRLRENGGHAIVFDWESSRGGDQ